MPCISRLMSWDRSVLRGKRHCLTFFDNDCSIIVLDVRKTCCFFKVKVKSSQPSCSRCMMALWVPIPLSHTLLFLGRCCGWCIVHLNQTSKQTKEKTIKDLWNRFKDYGKWPTLPNTTCFALSMCSFSWIFEPTTAKNLQVVMPIGIYLIS